MSWAQKRRLLYLGTLSLIILIIGFLIYWFNRPSPDCFDNIKNQDEENIDCGGVCLKVCEGKAVDPSVLWSRTTKVQDGLYNGMAYIRNSNLKASAKNVPYVFKVYDRENTLIYEREGRVSLPAQKDIAVFEPGFRVGYSIPEHVYFSFTAPIVWSQDEAVSSSLTVKDKQIFNASSTPKIIATITNASLKTIKNIEAVVVVYDLDDNARNFSRYIIDQISPESDGTAIYTWPEPFDFTPARIEIILRPDFQQS